MRTFYASIAAAVSLVGCGLGNPDLRILPDGTPSYEIDGGFVEDRGVDSDQPTVDVGSDLGPLPDVRDAATDRGGDVVDVPLDLGAPDAPDAEVADVVADVGSDTPEDASVDVPADAPIDTPSDRPSVDVPPDVGVDAPIVDAGADVPVVDVPAVDVPPADVIVPISWRVVDADQASTAWRSGAPSGSFDNLYCPPGQLLVGLATWGDALVSGLAPWCARLNADGTLGTAVRGDRQGGVCCVFSEDDRCPANQAIVRLVINSGAVVDRVQAVCAPLPGWLARREIGATLTGRGGGGGSRNTDDCPTGYVGSGLNLQSGGYQLIERVRSLRMRCSRVTDR